ncbi:MAG: hypothetical protein OHK0029_10470 [Armatimonadaceae bacterium]
MDGSWSGGGSAGTVEGDYRTDAYRVALAASADTTPTASNLPDNPLGYLGGLGYWHEPELGLQYVRARHGHRFSQAYFAGW